jgi:carbohydrate-selective porin OprB
MTGPVLPNGQAVDFKLLKHYGDQIEVEHRHEFNDQPGSVRVLVWRNRAKLATFADATRYGDSIGWQPGANGMEYILDVRGGEKIKHGIGFNADQAVGRDAGVFVRAMWGDGKTETYAFGEVDRSLSLGGVLTGQRWGRAQDTVGAAYIAHFLSADRRNYLAKGGISFFIGDGWLNYKPEQIVELYYNLKVSKALWVTANYQRYANPAYNADRGPVHVMGVRLHTEF